MTMVIFSVGIMNCIIAELKIPMGQNWAHGYENWTAAIMGWHEEINFYKFGLPPKSYLGKRNWTEIAHYTLVIFLSLDSLREFSEIAV